MTARADRRDAEHGDDVIDALAALPPFSRVATLRRQREDVRQAVVGSFEALFNAPSGSGLSPAERELAALRVAHWQRDAPLAALHQDRAIARGATVGDAMAALDPVVQPAGAERATALLRFVDRLTLEPAAARPNHLDDLLRHGLRARDVVTLAQLVAFVNFEVRLLAGLRALAAPPAVVAVDPPGGRPRRGVHDVRAGSAQKVAYTTDVLQWAAWLEPVALAHADAEQLAVLDESNASARTSPYYLTLVHDAPVLRQRSKLYNAIMYGQGGLPRADRELTTLGVSLTNGCPYCASVHARLFAQLSKEPGVVQALFDHGVNTALAPRHRALIDLAVALSQNPPAPLAPRLVELRAAGLAEAQILDAVNAAAIFAWANRLMQTLGEPVAPG